MRENIVTIVTSECSHNLQFCPVPTPLINVEKARVAGQNCQESQEGEQGEVGEDNGRT